MILNSRKRRQIQQAQRAGQAMVIEIGKEMQAAGMEQQQVNEQIAGLIAPGSARASWWADAKFVELMRSRAKNVSRETLGAVSG